MNIAPQRGSACSGETDRFSAFSTSVEETAKTADDQTAQFRAWMEQYFKKGISDERHEQVEQYAGAFEQILTKAAQDNAEANPLAFVQNLSAGEREVLQHIHCLAKAILPTGLSEEGALNLLRSPGSAKDIDRDGFQMVGAAKTWTFPPPDAPVAVRRAWDETVAGLDDSQVMLLQGAFLPLTISGNASGSSYLGADADYGSLVRRVLDGAEAARGYDEPWQVETRNREIELLEEFLSHLVSAKTPEPTATA